ncbi:MAG TPA: PIG-L family deacetylase [Patescibacteria group bacterium]|nr:PIG-L family deacetylase [Patescibacteria group bacterium]
MNHFDIKPGEGALFAHAHGDDEAMATAAAADSAAASGAAMYGVTAVDGSAGRNPDGNSNLAQERSLETTVAWEHLGVRPERQFLLGLPDRGVHSNLHVPRIAAALAAILEQHDITALFAPDEGGFDGHRHHSDVGRAVLLAAQNFNGVVWLLNSQGSGDVVVPVNPYRKLQVLRLHATQFPGIQAAPEGQEPPPGYELLYGHFVLRSTAKLIQPYEHLLHEETYDAWQPPRRQRTLIAMGSGALALPGQ